MDYIQKGSGEALEDFVSRVFEGVQEITADNRGAYMFLSLYPYYNEAMALLREDPPSSGRDTMERSTYLSACFDGVLEDAEDVIGVLLGEQHDRKGPISKATSSEIKKVIDFHNTTSIAHNRPRGALYDVLIEASITSDYALHKLCVDYFEEQAKNPSRYFLIDYYYISSYTDALFQTKVDMLMEDTLKHVSPKDFDQMREEVLKARDIPRPIESRYKQMYRRMRSFRLASQLSDYCFTATQVSIFQEDKVVKLLDGIREYYHGHLSHNALLQAVEMLKYNKVVLKAKEVLEETEYLRQYH